MAVIDAQSGAVVIRIVYDGPPLAGKTTTLQSLGALLRVDVATPATRHGRTLFFDWLDYEGGLFEGRAIRCQLVTVPGQDSLRARRDHLLEDADVVILVADTRAERFGTTVDLYRRLLRRARASAPPVGVVVQANQRDALTALSLDEVETQLDEIAPVRIVETVATEATGVREGFVFGVRLALDRVRALTQDGELQVGRARTNSAAELLTALTDMEAKLQSLVGEPNKPGEPSKAAKTIKTVSEQRDAHGGPAPGDRATSSTARAVETHETHETHASAEAAPSLSPSTPGGFIWPPVDGRATIAAAASADLAPRRLPTGHWAARQGGWLMFSSCQAVFDSAASGRARLVTEARAHTRCRDFLTERRALVLLPAGGGRMRLWHVVREERSLADRLHDALREADASAVATHLTIVADQLVLARDRCRGVVDGLPCGLGAVTGHAGATPRFVGVLPWGVEQRAAEPTGKALLAREMQAVVYRIKKRRQDQAAIGAALRRLAKPDAGSAALVDLWEAVSL